MRVDWRGAEIAIPVQVLFAPAQRTSFRGRVILHACGQVLLVEDFVLRLGEFLLSR
jgi:hypothetical protein